MKLTTSKVAVGLVLAGALSAAPAQAQNRAFVGAAGSDTNPCTFVAPCRSLQHAHDTVSANGEIDVLDPAGYGTLMINRAISINGHGYAEILVGSGGTGISINAAGAAINLSGLIIDGQGVGTFGIVFNSGGSLTVDNTVIRTVTTDGIRVIPVTLSGTTTSIFVSNSRMSNNGSAGIFIFPSGQGFTRVSLNHVETNNNGNFGVLAKGSNITIQGAIQTAISDSIATGNGQIGFYNFQTPGLAGSVEMVLFRSVANFNATGAASDGSASAVIFAQTALTLNSQNDWNSLNGGGISSFQDNYVFAGPAPMPLGKQ